jgi:hypothetical protein
MLEALYPQLLHQEKSKSVFVENNEVPSQCSLRMLNAGDSFDIEKMLETSIFHKLSAKKYRPVESPSLKMRIIILMTATQIIR